MSGPGSLHSLQIETPRLRLRVPRSDDLDAWAVMMEDPITAAFIGGAVPLSVSWRALMAMIGSWHAHGFAMFSVVEKSTGRWVGRVGPWRPAGWPGTEVGWSIVRDCWGRGYATEAAIASGTWALAHLGWTEIIHSIAPANVASQRVAAKLGSRNRGPGVLPAPYEGEPIDVWGQTAEEWRSRHSGRLAV